MKKNPIFIIGNPRSGTTLLRLILHTNSNITIPPEAGFAMWLYNDFVNYSNSDLDVFLNRMKLTKKINNWNISWGQFKNEMILKQAKNYSDLINHIYLYYGKSINKVTQRWGDKNNYYLNFIEQIKTLFPDAYFIHIVRDGRNIACSYKNLNKKRIISTDAPVLPNEIGLIANEWNKNITTIQNGFKAIKYNKVLEVRLEDLTTYPVNTLKIIMSFIGEEYEPQMLEYYKVDEKHGGEPVQYIQWKDKNTRPIINEPANKYENELSAKEINTFETIAGNYLKYYKY